MRMAGIASVNHSILTLKGNATYSVFGYLEFVVLFFLTVNKARMSTFVYKSLFTFLILN